MRQLTYLEPGRVEWLEAPEPALTDPGQAIVEPLAVASCDLDKAIVAGLAPFQGPFALGHEMIGRVVEAGDGVSGVRPGDTVAVPFQVSCGECEHCRRGISAGCKRGGMYGIGEAGGGFGGALADRVLVPFADAMLIGLPEGIDPAVAASAPDNIADAWRAITPPLAERPGGRVLILAGQGANSIPLYAVQIARASGAGAVEVLTIDADTGRRAGELGAEVAVVEAWPQSHGRFDVVLEAANQPAGLTCALRSLRTGGHCTVCSLHFGNEVTIPVMEMYVRNVTLEVGRANSRQALPAVLELIRSGAIEPAAVTSEQVAWDDAAEALLGYTTKLVVTRG